MAHLNELVPISQSGLDTLLRLPDGLVIASREGLWERDEPRVWSASLHAGPSEENFASGCQKLIQC